MTFFKLCSDDKLVNTLHAVFHANIVRIPETRFQPLSVIALTSGKPHFWGSLRELTEATTLDAQLFVQESRMADISGKRSRSVHADLGIQILQGFLSGFNLPSAAIAAKFTGAKTVSFSFGDVVRYYISPSQMGTLLQGQALDAGKASNGIFLRREAQLLVIDSIITSKDFSISVETSNTNDFSLDVPAIQKIIGEAKTGVHVARSTGMNITFQGNTPLAFAFTCLNCVLNEAGSISLKPNSATTHFAPNQSMEHLLLFDEPGMIEWSS